MALATKLMLEAGTHAFETSVPSFWSLVKRRRSEFAESLMIIDTGHKLGMERPLITRHRLKGEPVKDLRENHARLAKPSIVTGFNMQPVAIGIASAQLPILG